MNIHAPPCASHWIRKTYGRFLIPLVLVTLSQQALAEPDLISVQQAVTEARKAPDYRFSYGPHPFQFGDLRLPSGEGPYPVAVVIHGGCWQNRYDLHLMDAMSEALADDGWASWNIEYRRTGHPSGGWPGTFEDVQLATHYLGNLSTRHALDLQRVLIIGHSSGGHLALWLARHWSIAGGDLDPAAFSLAAVVALAPVTDLIAVSDDPDLGCHGSVAPFMGGSPEDHPDRYRSASPFQFGRIGVPYTLVSGARDAIVPPAAVKRYHGYAERRGDTVRHKIIDGAGHFELIAPDTSAWPEIAVIIEGFE